eukprot:1158712-Pelagomonas_calceolata.AAC.8
MWWLSYTQGNKALIRIQIPKDTDAGVSLKICSGVVETRSAGYAMCTLTLRQVKSGHGCSPVNREGQA